MIKHLDDYMPAFQKLFPDMSKTTLKKFLEWAFNKYNTLLLQNKDVVVKNGNFKSYCGKKFTDDEIRALYLAEKTKSASRYIHRQTNPYFSGVYYLGLTEEDWKSAQYSLKKRLPRHVFTNVYFYKSRTECFRQTNKDYFIELFYPVDLGWRIFFPEITLDKYRLIAARDKYGKVKSVN